VPHQSVAWLAVEVLVLAVFVAGMLGNARFWLGGGLRPGQPATNEEKLRAALRTAAAALRPAALGGLVLDGLLQRRLLRISLLRWLVHFGLVWGMGVLFFVGSLGLMLAGRGLLPLTKDTPWFASLNDLAGLLVILGAAAAVYRRATAREKLPSVLSHDRRLMALLAFIVLSGFGVEAVRLVAEQVPPPIGWYSFLGYPLAQALAALPLDWSTAYQVVWWLHALSAQAFVAYVPYSAMLHLFAGPLALVARAGKPVPGH
jgi:nitrate reductase gamma subunit